MAATHILMLLLVEGSGGAACDIDLLRRVTIGRDVTMNRRPEQLVQVFLIRCPAFGRPMSVALATGERNMEETDSRSFALGCDCGWSGTIIGLYAKKHCVESRN